MGRTVTVVTFLGSFIRDRDRFKGGRSPVLERVQVFGFQMVRKLVETLLAFFQYDGIAVRQGSDIRQVQGLIQILTKPRLGVPVIKGHR